MVGYYKDQYDDRDEEEMDMDNIKWYTTDTPKTVLNDDPKDTYKDILKLELTLDIFSPSTTVKVLIT